jgi:hypothetical protein
MFSAARTRAPPGAEFPRTHGARNRPSGLSVPSVLAVTYGYDAASRLQTVTNGANVATYGYATNAALVEAITLTNAGATRLTTTKSYDKINRLASVSNTPSAGAALSHGYTYNAANQRTPRHARGQRLQELRLRRARPGDRRQEISGRTTLP